MSLRFKQFIKESVSVVPQLQDVNRTRSLFPELLAKKKKKLKKFNILNPKAITEDKTVTGRKVGFTVTNTFGGTQYGNIKQAHPHAPVRSYQYTPMSGHEVARLDAIHGAQMQSKKSEKPNSFKSFVKSFAGPSTAPKTDSYHQYHDTFETPKPKKDKSLIVRRQSRQKIGMTPIPQNYLNQP